MDRIRTQTLGSLTPTIRRERATGGWCQKKPRIRPIPLERNPVFYNFPEDRGFVTPFSLSEAVRVPEG